MAEAVIPIIEDCIGTVKNRNAKDSQRMYNLKDDLEKEVKDFFISQHGINVDAQQIQWQPTRDDFEGEITLVVFPFVKLLKLTAEEIAQAVGMFIQQKLWQVSEFNVVKGFLNLKLSDIYTKQLFENHIEKNDFMLFGPQHETVLVEYSSPNTNKPLHLGHLRNIFLGDSVARILAKVGYDVKKVQVINDRGIHICKSMLAWQKFGSGETPSSSGLKGDNLVGKYYVKFDQVYKSEVAELTRNGMDEKTAKLQAPILLEAQEVLRKWEASDPSVVALWETMNTWVYEGFSQTYNKMRVLFDKLYYESETYLKGKSVAEKGIIDCMAGQHS
jgi:arginyl-tRNA synthetase